MAPCSCGCGRASADEPGSKGLSKGADVRNWPILLQNSLLRCQRAIIESEKPASRIRYCALWLVLESMLRVGSLENSFATISARSGEQRCPLRCPLSRDQADSFY